MTSVWPAASAWKESEQIVLPREGVGEWDLHEERGEGFGQVQEHCVLRSHGATGEQDRAISKMPRSEQMLSRVVE